jgi:hypothetical protein
LTAPSEREWPIYRRGEKRESLLRDYREGLRLRLDPETRQPITESVIQQATAKGGRFYREADALDLILLGPQRRAEWLVQQLHIDRAATTMLDGYHGKLWGPRLPAFGASGTVEARGIPGTTWPGSTTVPDTFATIGTDSAGNRYQVVVAGIADGDGVAPLTLIAIAGGDATNIDVGEVITWESPPPGSEGTATVTARFRGGRDAETDGDYSKRMLDRVRHKPASGNWSHIRTYARDASVSVADAFVYPCAFYAGSELVAVVQKRAAGDTRPTGRVPSLSVLTAVRNAVVPPASPFVPGRVHVVVVPPVTEPSDLVLQLAQPLGSTAGWRDLTPFPRVGSGAGSVAITTLTSQTDFRVTAASAGQLSSSPSSDVHVMVWDAALSSFESLAVSTVTDMGAGVYRIQLSAPPTKTLALGDWISPDMSRRAALAAAIVTYFDGLGPGEVIDLATDERSVRAYRNPVPNEESPARAGQAVINVITEALGSPVSDATLVSVSLATPTVPIDPVLGPSLLVAGKVGVYNLA